MKTEAFTHTGKGKLQLDKQPTGVQKPYKDKADYKKLLKASQKAINRRQRMMYAHNRYSMLLIFQAMDAAGKDGTIRAVMSGVNVHGVSVHAFQQPTSNELEHDFLWRTTLRLPQRGKIGIFNRSYYEEVLVVRVHPEFLDGRNIPHECISDTDKLWAGRFASIRDYEAHLHRNGTRVLKFFLHLGRDEQRDRFLSRIDEPEKNWKFSEADIAERQYWSAYQDAYEEMINATATREAPWFVVPADDKKTMRLIVSRIVLDHLESLDMEYPQVTDEQQKQLQHYRKRLAED